MDDNTREIAEQIFNKPPQAINSIQLDLEDTTADIAAREGVQQYVFEILSVILLHGIEILFGHRDILRLSEKDFYLLQEYANSFGYKINKRIDENNRLLIIGFEHIY
jgi:hypothetical protein